MHWFGFNFVWIVTVLLVARSADVTGQQQQELQAQEQQEANLRWRNYFHNWCKTPKVGGKYEQLFRPKNSVGGDYQDEDFETGLVALQDVVAQAEKNGNKRVRAYGQKLSETNILYTSDYLVESKGLNYLKIGIDIPAHVAADYQSQKDHLVFVQSGIMVKHLHQALKAKGLALQSSLNPDGARFVGAVMTGSHSSVINVGAMHDYVKGIHLVLTGGKHVFVQRDSDRVVTDSYVEESLGNATFLNNDDMFNAAVVSFGCFGLVHGMLIEVEPLYKLKMQIREVAYKDFKSVVSTLDLSGLGFGGDVTSERPYDITIAINPFKRKRGFWVKILQRVDDTSNIETMMIDDGGPEDVEQQENDDTLLLSGNDAEDSVLSTVWSVVTFPKRFIFGVIVNRLTGLVYGKRDSGKVKYSYEWYGVDGTEKDAAPLTSGMLMYYEMEVFVPITEAERTVDLMLKVVNRRPILAAIGLRYNKMSNVTLATNHYGDLTASVGLLSLYTRVPLLFRKSKRVFAEVAKELVAQNIPHSYHYGKIFPMNKQWAANSYGSELVDWQTQRSVLLDAAGQEIFANQVMKDVGILE